MQKPLHPNKLRILVKEAGLTMREVHRETEIPESTLRWWASGHGVIPKEERVTLARLIGCTTQDLAPIHAEEVVGKSWCPAPEPFLSVISARLCLCVRLKVLQLLQ